jgi:dihydropteroate synthase
MKEFWCCEHKLQLHKPSIMGILNATPDSFVASSRVEVVEDALVRAQAMIDAGATILDVGGESTRPGASFVDVETEIARVVPVITALHAAFPEVLISVDTFKVAVARAALDAGAVIINDVHGTQAAQGMWELVRERGAGYVWMHSRGDAQSMDGLAQYEDVVEEVLTALTTAAQTMETMGIAREQVMLDVGLGFAKRAEDSLRLLEATDRFAALPYGVLVGASRKRFLALLQAGEGSIVERSVLAAGRAVTLGANVVRVHDVLETRTLLEGLQYV